MLKGKAAVVTGATSGIGLAILKALAAEGCDVLFNGLGDDREIEALRRGVAEAFGVTTLFHGADLSKPDEIPGLIETAEAAFSGIDILVNNAGIQYVSPVETFPTERWDTVLAINLSAQFHTIRTALPGMKRRGWGRIINIASVNGLVASTNRAAYIAAKHGVVGLTKAVALEMAENNITCNAICPGLTRTQLMEDQLERRAAEHGLSMEAAAVEHVAEKHPSKKYVTVEEITALAVFLCGDGAATITGAALPVDGGWLTK